MKLRYDKDGKKMYPVCSWEKNQHKLYNANDRLWNALYDAQDAGDWDRVGTLQERIGELQNALSVFDSYVYDGIVYAPYKVGMIIKNYIWAYNARH